MKFCKNIILEIKFELEYIVDKMGRQIMRLETLLLFFFFPVDLGKILG